MDGEPGNPSNTGQAEGDGAALRAARTGPGLPVRLMIAAGPAERYPRAGDDAVLIAAGRWDTVESWAAARKLAAIREAIRRRPLAGHGAAQPGALPAVWRKDLAEEIALELGISRPAAGALIGLAHTLEARLPLTAAALDAGVLNTSKARLIADETAVLTDEDAGEAEALVAPKWTGKTWSQIRDLITRAVVNIDPEGCEKRREQAEREDARVRFWREHAGTAGLAGYGLPADQALKANQNIAARARAYRRHGIPGTLDLLRVMAMLDLLNGTDARDRHPQAPAGTGTPGTAGAPDGAGDDAHGGADGLAGDAPDGTGSHGPDGDTDDDAWDRGDDDPEGDDVDGDDGGPDDGADDGGPGNGGPGGRGPRGSGPGGRGADEGLAANVDLTIPLADLDQRARRAGHAHGLGVLDPALARRLAAEAAKNPGSVFRIILTDERGQAIGFGHATRRRQRKPEADTPPAPGHQPPGTFWDSTLAPGTSFTPAGPGPDGGYGTWTLDLAGRQYTVTLHAIPDGSSCDHRYETDGYRPSTILRRLVAVRDGQCAMPVCVRHPSRCDWEHAVPWPAGATCACNGGYHCRHDHLIKQDPRWKVEQLPEGRQWTTPAGLTYTKGPAQHPI